MSISTDDAETSRLIYQLLLEDIGDIEKLERSHRGKVTGAATPTAEDMALRSQAEGYRIASQLLEDRALAKSIDSALETDQPLLEHHQRVEQAAVDDRETALRLSNEMAPPTKTEPQRAAESVSLPPQPEHSHPKAEVGAVATRIVVSSVASSSASLQSAATSQSRLKGQPSTNLNVSADCAARGDSTTEELVFLFSFLLLSLFI